MQKKKKSSKVPPGFDASVPEMSFPDGSREVDSSPAASNSGASGARTQSRHSRRWNERKTDRDGETQRAKRQAQTETHDDGDV